MKVSDVVWTLFFLVSFKGMLTTMYSAEFLNGEFPGDPNSGNPGKEQEKLRNICRVDMQITLKM